jgi:hypothetical protein
MRYSFIIKIFLTILVGLLFVGCSPTKEITEIKPIVIRPPVIQDSLPANFFNNIFQANKIIGKDTVQSIKFIPDSALLQKVKELYAQNKKLGIKLKAGEFNFKIKPDSVVYWDTVKTVQTIEKIIETPLLSKIGLIFIGIVLAIAGGIIAGKK